MRAMAVRLALVSGLLAPAQALAAHSGWIEADESQLRLLLTAPQAGRISGGVEIVLEPGWYTYWRNPGETGVPPLFDFSASENIADVAVAYPAPSRHDDGASVSLIYRDEVVFPLAITPIDPGRPVTLRVALQFGVCSEICIPTSARAELTSSDAADPLAAARVADYLERVPRPPEPGLFDIETVTAEADALLVAVRMPQATPMDLFADPPAGWYLGQPAFVARDGDVSTYRLSLAGMPSGASPVGQTFTFVAVSGGKAIEKALQIR